MSRIRSVAVGAVAVAAVLAATASPALAQTTTSTNSGGLNPAVLLIGGIVFGVACGFVAKSKNRSVALWAILGFLFGFIPLIIIAVLKKKEPETGYGMASGTYSSTPPPPPPPPPA
jgi:heme/copper-type cytochrome/quinol oxidase subunit 3